jgi:hypothetical protein
VQGVVLFHKALRTNRATPALALAKSRACGKNSNSKNSLAGTGSQLAAWHWHWHVPLAPGIWHHLAYQLLAYQWIPAHPVVTQ